MLWKIKKKKKSGENNHENNHYNNHENFKNNNISFTGSDRMYCNLHYCKRLVLKFMNISV